MSSTKGRIVILWLLPIFATLTLPRPASAQCGLLSQEFQNVALETSNAFVADYSTNISSLSGARFSHAGFRSVARDSEGRIRIVRAAGKYVVKGTDGVATEMDRLNIIICDPATRTTTVLDTAAKSATVSAPPSGLALVKPASSVGESFCTALFTRRERLPRTQTEDLGHQTISGYDAIGVRIHFAPLLGTSSGPAASSYSELWCSDALGALIQQTQGSRSQNGRESKTDSTMKNIERREPEPSLFQIPADYTIIERDVSADRKPLARPIPAPPDSKPQ